MFSSWEYHQPCTCHRPLLGPSLQDPASWDSHLAGWPPGKTFNQGWKAHVKTELGENLERGAAEFSVHTRPAAV